jgi:multidrug efflux pump
MLVSGMFIGTAFTLFVVPSIYMLVAKTHTAVRDDDNETITVHDTEEVMA